MQNYDHKNIDTKWQEYWKQNSTYKTDIRGSKEKCYVLDMFPYPSGEGLHVGHPKGYIATDIYSRFKKMQGYEVLHPMGFDAFGLPAEQYAIKNKLNPKDSTEKNVERFKKQLENIGLNYDWSREVNTTDPNFYKWTQWIWKQMHKKGLAYQSHEPINWCPSCKTGLANEDLDDGRCERCESVVEKKPIRQWVLKITDYADRMLSDLDALNWPEHIKEAQRNWIGKSEGAEINFDITGANYKNTFTVFTTRPDTIFGATYCVLAPEHKIVRELLEMNICNNTKEIFEYIGNAIQKNEIERSAEGKEKTGVKLGGVYAINPANQKEMPVYIADYVLAGYGTGAIMAVPAHDARDAEFAKVFNIVDTQQIEVGTALPDAKEVEGSTVIAYDKDKNLFLKLNNLNTGETWLPSGGRDTGESFRECAIRELSEEAGVSKIEKIVELGAPIISYYFNINKNSNRKSLGYNYLAFVSSEEKNNFAHEAHEKFSVEWVTYEELYNSINDTKGGVHHWIEALQRAKNYIDNKFVFPAVVEPMYEQHSGDSAMQEGLEFQNREVAAVAVRNPKDDTYLTISWKGMDMKGFVTGGLDGDDLETAARKEILEETGYKNLKLNFISPFNIHTKFYQRQKKVNRHARWNFISFDLMDEERESVSEEENKNHEIIWVKKDKLNGYLSFAESICLAKIIYGDLSFMCEEGILKNSGEFDGLTSDEAKVKIVKKVGGKTVSKYKIKDWVFARQRYWGEPFPIVFDENGKEYVVVDSELPIQLPPVDNYEPTGNGESPLADIDSFVHVYGYLNNDNEFVTGSKDDGKSKLFKRETNTMPQWAGSSWYYLRYVDNNNSKELIDKELEKKWSPVDVYVGGDHATRHLIYARFWHKFLYDIGVVHDSEPFKRLEFLGFILAEDGRKMSKRWGNVIDPNDVIEKWGADTLRVYEMFMGPFEKTVSWSEASIKGVARFLDRFVALQDKIVEKESESIIHKTIKKVGEDIESFKFNTAVSQMMICLNECEEKGLSREDYKNFVRILAPFAPHLCEELWQNALGEASSIYAENWPKYDANKLESSEVTMVLQVNGKLRGSFEIARDTEDAEIISLIKTLEPYNKYVVGEPKKVIIIKNRLVNVLI